MRSLGSMAMHVGEFDYLDGADILAPVRKENEDLKMIRIAVKGQIFL